MKKILNLFIYIGFVALTLTIVSSCTSSKSVNLLQDISPDYPSRPFRDYKLQYNDEIYCSVLTSNTDFSNEFNGTVSSSGFTGVAYAIYANGCISIPYFGDIYLLGQTIEQAQETVQNRMRQAFPDAQARVTLRNNAFYVVSEERRGRFQLYKDNTTIYQALALTGRPSQGMDLSKVKIVRTDEAGRSYVKTFDLRAESIIESEFYYIKPNDLIYYSTSTRAFFNVNSFQSFLSILIAPIGAILTIISIDNYFK